MAGRGRAGIGIHNGRLYMIGGVNIAGHSNTVEYASLLPGGGLGTWQAATFIPLSGIPRSGWIAGGYAFATEISEGGPTKKVLSAPINANGSLGSWTETTQLPKDSLIKMMLAANGYVYLYWDGKNYKAPILAGGLLGAWEEAHSFGPSTAFYGATVYRGAIYSSGSNASVPASIFSKLSSIARSASYSRLLDFDVDVSPARLMVNGAASASLGIKTSTGTGNSFSSLKGQGFAPGSLQNIVDIDGGVGRWWQYKYDLDETSTAVFPDAPGNLTDFTFWYHPNPVRRLRGGKTFTGGAQQSLDASP